MAGDADCLAFDQKGLRQNIFLEQRSQARSSTTPAGRTSTKVPAPKSPTQSSLPTRCRRRSATFCNSRSPKCRPKLWLKSLRCWMLSAATVGHLAWISARTQHLVEASAEQRALGQTRERIIVHEILGSIGLLLVAQCE